MLIGNRRRTSGQHARAMRQTNVKTLEVENKKSPQILRLMPPLCWTNILAGKQYEYSE